MSKKAILIIERCCAVAILIIFEIIMYFAVGEEILMQKGPMRIFWLLFPLMLCILSILAENMINKIYKNKDKE